MDPDWTCFMLRFGDSRACRAPEDLQVRDTCSCMMHIAGTIERTTRIETLLHRIAGRDLLYTVGQCRNEDKNTLFGFQYDE